MSFFRKKQSKEDQKKLEHQLHLAKHSPDSVVDVSGCGLLEVPPGIYALCKVLLKQAFICHSNKLRNLKDKGSYADFLKLKYTIRVLDLHENLLEELPPDIGQLSQLQVLNLEANALRTLPEGFGCLRSLQTLNLKGNRLSTLPESVGSLSSLRFLDVSHNGISRLPDSMAALRCLETLILDVSEMEFPPSEVCAQGTEKTMKHLCGVSGVGYEPPSRGVLPLLNIPNSSASPRRLSPARNRSSSYQEMDCLAAATLQYEQAKDLKRKEQARLQQTVLDARAEAATLVADTRKNRDRLLGQIAKEQDELESKLYNLQLQKDIEKQQLLAAITEMEAHARKLVKQILTLNREIGWTERRIEEEEQRRMTDEKELQVKYEEYQRLKKAEIERAMGSMMAQNLSIDELRKFYERQKSQFVDRAHTLDAEFEDNVDAVLQMKDRMARQLLEQLVEDMEFQKDALLALMEQRDARCNRLNQQITLIQEELAQLSQLEMKNKDVRAANNQACLEHERFQLTKLLLQLLDEKQKRNVELQKRLIEMERARESNQMDFWLMQYQRLLERKPNELADQEKQLDSAVVKVLQMAGAEDFIPAFARHRISVTQLPQLKEEDLQRIGIYQVGLRQAVLEEILNRGRRRASDFAMEPSAPPLGVVAAHFEMECVVCMDNQSSLVFVPCGHVCCCGPCGKSLSQCPLCRAELTQRVDIGSSVPSAPPSDPQ